METVYSKWLWPCGLLAWIPRSKPITILVMHCREGLQLLVSYMWNRQIDYTNATTKCKIIMHIIKYSNTLCCAYLSLAACTELLLLPNCKSWMARTHSFNTDGLYPEYCCNAKLWKMCKNIIDRQTHRELPKYFTKSQTV